MDIHVDGFEEFGGETNPSVALGRADYTATGQWALVAGRIGGAALSARGAALSRKVPWKTGKFACGFAHQFDGRGSVAWLKIGAKQIALWLNPDTGLPCINDGIGGALPTIARWYFFELEIERDIGRVSLYINNRLDSAYDLDGPPSEQEVTVSLGYLAPSAYRDGAQLPTDNSAKTYDDFYTIDGARLGPISVTTRFPTADKKIEWFAADSTKTHAQSLALHPPKPLDNYVASNVVGKEDRFTSVQGLNSANTIVATGLVVLARKSPQLNVKLGVFMGGAANAPLRQDSRTLESDWRTQFVFFDKNNSDTVAGIVAADFGINVQSST